MNKFRKYLVLLFVLAMCLLLTPKIDSYALIDGADQGDRDTDYDHSGWKEGVASSKTGYLVWLSDSSGAMWSGVAFVPTRGSMFYPNDSSIIPKGFPMVTRNNNAMTSIVETGSSVPWGGLAPIDDGCEGALESFLRSEYNGYDSGVEWCMDKYLGLGDTDRDFIMDKVESGSEICINFESIALIGRYEGMDYADEVWYGNVITFAAIMDEYNAMSRFTHTNMPNNVYLTRNWLSLRQVTNPSGKHTSAEILSYPRKGFGLASYMLKTGDKNIVKVYTTDGNVDKTTYGKGSSPYQVKNEGPYKVKKWATSEYETNERGNKATWAQVTTGCEPFTQQGTGAATVTMDTKEKTLFILYERPTTDPQESPPTEALKAFEVNWIYPNMTGNVTRLDNGSKPAEFDFKSKFDTHKNSMNSQDHIKDYESIGTKFKVKEPFSGALSGLNKGQLHLYRTDIGQYSAITEAKEFDLGIKVRPHYAYNLTREAFEPELIVSSYRSENGSMLSYVTGVLKIQSGNKGEMSGVGISDNQEILLNEVKSDTYKFTAEIDAKYQEGTPVKQEGSDGNVYDLTDPNTYTDLPEDVEINGEVVEYGNWQDKTETFSVDIATYNREHTADKYRAPITPTGMSRYVGTVAASNDGGSILGSYRSSEAVITQLSPTLKIYPEVMYKLYYDVIGEYDTSLKADGARDIYLMGERARQIEPAVVHGYRAYSSPSPHKGALTLATPMTGTFAEKLLDSYSSGGFYNGVTTMGSTFEVASTSKFKIDFVTGAICFTGVTNDGVDWDNGGYNAAVEASHNAYVNALSSKVRQEIVMQYFKPNGAECNSEPMHIPVTYNEMKTVDNQVITKDLYFHTNVVDGLGDTCIEIGRNILSLDAGAIQSAWDIAYMFDTAFISCTDPDSDNNSGSLDSGAERYGRRKWYDEESKQTLVFKIFKTTVEFGQMIGDDKTDYNLLKQEANKYLSRGKEDSLEARFYARLYFNNTSVNIDGSHFTLVENILVPEIKNTRFILGNFTNTENRN